MSAPIMLRVAAWLAAVLLVVVVAVDALGRWVSPGMGLSYFGACDAETVGVVLFDTDRRHSVCLTASTPFVHRFTWSPDGRWLAYSARTDEIVVQRVATGHERRYDVEGLSAVTNIAFSPDGRRIALVQTPGVTGQLATLDLETGTVTPREERYRLISSLAWAAEGEQRLAYVANQNATETIFTLPPDLNGAPAAVGNGITPGWSADSERLVFTTLRGGLTRVVIANADGTAPTALTLPGLSPFSVPSWQPNGTQIAVTTAPGTTRPDIYVIQVDTVGIENITQTPALSESHPAWSPDGQWIAYSATGRGAREQIFLYRPADRLSRQLTAADARHHTPVWRPAR